MLMATGFRYLVSNDEMGRRTGKGGVHKRAAASLALLH
jgi:hypothetical protein